MSMFTNTHTHSATWPCSIRGAVTVQQTTTIFPSLTQPRISLSTDLTLGRLDLGHVFSPVAAPDPVLTGIASLRLAHPQFLRLEEVKNSLYPTTGQGLRIIGHLGVMASFEGGVGG